MYEYLFEFSVVFLLVLLVILQVLKLKGQSVRPTINIEHIKISYGLFVTILQEYDNYFISFEFTKFTKVKENELTESEYKLLSKKYITEFFNQNSVDNSLMLNNVILEIFGSHEGFILYLKRRFDLILYKNYPSLGLSQNKPFDFK